MVIPGFSRRSPCQDVTSSAPAPPAPPESGKGGWRSRRSTPDMAAVRAGFVPQREVVHFAFLDSTMALFVNAAIRIVAGATFHRTGYMQVAEIKDAYKLLTPLPGAGATTRLLAIVPAAVVAILLWGIGHQPAPHPQPGDSQLAVVVRRRPAGHVHLGARLDGLMFKKILLPVEHSSYDAAIVEYLRDLAKWCGASVLLVLGKPARPLPGAPFA